jgi:hypothetical protein
MNNHYCKQTTKYKLKLSKRYYATCLRFLVLFSLFIQANAFAQDTYTDTVKDTGPSIMVGTQIPLQYSVGVNYHFSPLISARAQFGLLTKPYDRMVLAIMEQFGLEKSTSRLIERSLNNGLMYTLGGNYHFGKNYAGIYGQHARLSGNISLEDAASAYFDRDLSFLSPFGVSLLEVSAKSNITNIGFLYGRRFTLPNPRFEILAEAGIAKIIGSSNQFSSNQRLLEQVPLVKQLYRNLDADFADAYRRYGYLPTLNIYVNYHF